jgi:hypothetical protein
MPLPSMKPQGPRTGEPEWESTGGRAGFGQRDEPAPGVAPSVAVLRHMHLTREGATRKVSSLDEAELEGMVAGICVREGKPVGTAVTC